MSCQDWKKTNHDTPRCSCFSWKDHIESHSLRAWPIRCSVRDCDNFPTVGIPVIHNPIDGAKVIPVCSHCNLRTGFFDIKGSVSLVNMKRSECRVK